MSTIWKAFTPEELARLAPGETVVTWHEIYTSEPGKTRRYEKIFGERTFRSYSPFRGIVRVDFSFTHGRGETEFCDTHVGYYAVPAHSQLYGDFSSEED